VTVRHLRTRLHEYYQGEGRLEQYKIEIPKGKYVPVLLQRAIPQVLAEEELPESAPDILLLGSPANSTTLQPSALSPPATAIFPGRSIFRYPWFSLLLLLAGVLLGVAGGYFLRGTWNSARTQSSEAAGLLDLLDPTPQPLTVVVTDSNLQAYRMIFGKQVALQSYIDRSYQRDSSVNSDVHLANALAFATGSNETNVSSAIVAADIKSELPRRQIIIKQPHDVSIREFQDAEDIVLLGGPWINPWGQLFESRLKYRLIPMADNPAQSQLQVANPAPGETSELRPLYTKNNVNMNYVRIAILPNFSHTGHIFLVGATSPEALEAGGRFLGSNEHIPDILNRMHVSKVRDLPPLELVLEVRGLNAVPETSRILAVRPVP
jgi:hypothetical protein